MTANKMPVLPFSPYLVSEWTGHEVIDRKTWIAYTADQMRAMYLAGLEAARQAVPTYASPDYASPFSPPYAEGHEDGFGDCRDATLSNLTALEQEAKK